MFSSIVVCTRLGEHWACPSVCFELFPNKCEMSTFCVCGMNMIIISGFGLRTTKLTAFSMHFQHGTPVQRSKSMLMLMICVRWCVLLIFAWRRCHCVMRTWLFKLVAACRRVWILCTEFLDDESTMVPDCIWTKRPHTYSMWIFKNLQTIQSGGDASPGFVQCACLPWKMRFHTFAMA